MDRSTTVFNNRIIGGREVEEITIHPPTTWKKKNPFSSNRQTVPPRIQLIHGNQSTFFFISPPNLPPPEISVNVLLVILNKRIVSSAASCSNSAFATLFLTAQLRGPSTHRRTETGTEVVTGIVSASGHQHLSSIL